MRGCLKRSMMLSLAFVPHLRTWMDSHYSVHFYQKIKNLISLNNWSIWKWIWKGDATDIRYQVLVNCDLQMVGEEFSRKPYAVAVHEGSPLRDLLNDAILRLLNQRRLETLKERWWTENPEKKDCGDMNDQSDGISIQNIGSLLS